MSKRRQRRLEEISQSVDRGLGRWETVSRQATQSPTDAVATQEEVSRDPVQVLTNAANVGGLESLLPDRLAWQLTTRPIRTGSYATAPNAASAPLPMARKVVFRSGFIRTIARLIVWLWAGIVFFGGNAIDKVRGRSSVRNRAVRLRKVFEGLGVTYVKLGQQLALRADILPYDYCEELGQMLDRVPPFASEKAIAIVERNLGSALHEVFDRFDLDPVGSASVACVYRATLKTGESVAVKVRRPRIVERLAADLRALDWLLKLAEAMALLRPGLTENFRSELRSMLLAELDFRTEARFTDMFRRISRKQGLHATSAKVFFEYCTEEVLVTKFISGMPMWELMKAVDQNDVDKLEKARAMDISPKKLARRLARDVYVQFLECPFFHADPHPANLVVRPKNRIYFVDFASCGHFSHQMRNTWRQLHYHMLRKDVSRMVGCALALAEPLPHIDVEKFKKTLDNIIADWMYATESKDAEWWERCTSSMWMKYVQAAREFGVPMNLETLQYFRATLLYESVIMRLDTRFDVAGQYQQYMKQAGRRARGRVFENVFNRSAGLLDQDYLRIEELADIASQTIHRTQQMLESPTLNYVQMIGKVAFPILTLMQTIWIGALAIAFFFATRFLLVPNQTAAEVWKMILDPSVAWWLYVFLIMLGVVQLRKVLMRMRDFDVPRD